MIKKLPKIFIIFFIAVFVLQMAVLVFLVLQPNDVQAQIEYKPQVEIPGGPDGAINENSIGQYIAAIYKYGTGIVGILAAVVMMVGGLMWLTAGGNTSQVQSAQEWIKAALTGLIIALLSYIILLTINPDLVKFKPLKIDTVEEINKTESTGKTEQDMLTIVTVAEYRISGALADTESAKTDAGTAESDAQTALTAANATDDVIEAQRQATLAAQAANRAADANGRAKTAQRTAKLKQGEAESDATKAMTVSIDSAVSFISEAAKNATDFARQANSRVVQILTSQ